MKLIGRRPSPRVLLLGLSTDDAEALALLFPTVKPITFLGEVRQAEWDLLITGAGVPHDTEPTLFVVAFGTSPIGRPADISDFQYDGSRLEPDLKTFSTEFVIPNGLPPTVSELAEHQLLPAIQGELNYAIVETLQMAGGARHGRSPAAALRPFIATPEGHVIAGSFRRDGLQAECWSLPDEADPVPWVLAAIAEWQRMAPERFPSSAPWEKRAEWQTPSEATVAIRLSDLQARREDLLAQYDKEKRDLEAEQAIANDAANRRERLLLTAQGDDLKATVEQVLTDFGFRPQDMDEVFPAGDKREDFRVHVETSVVIEVRGYKDGAKTADLLRMGRFATRFAKDEGRLPDAMWYIVNQLKDRDPETRDQPFHSQPDDLAAFAEAGGLVIDTRDLLRMWLAVQAGAVTAEGGRSLLLGSTGLFRFPAR